MRQLIKKLRELHAKATRNITRERFGVTPATEADFLNVTFPLTMYEVEFEEVHEVSVLGYGPDAPGCRSVVRMVSAEEGWWEGEERTSPEYLFLTREDAQKEVDYIRAYFARTQAERELNKLVKERLPEVLAFAERGLG